MTLMFAMYWTIAGVTTERPALFDDLNRCLYFAEKIDNTEGVSRGQKIFIKAHCEPKWINTK